MKPTGEISELLKYPLLTSLEIYNCEISQLKEYPLLTSLTIPDKYYGEWMLKDGDVYDGELKYDIAHGYGVATYSFGRKYNGMWFHGKPHGHGTEKFNGDIYEGDWREGEYSGKGIKKWSNGDMYDGEWCHGTKYGKGIQIYQNGDEYEGEWYDGRKYGKGVLTKHTGEKYNEEWEGGVLKYSKLRPITSLLCEEDEDTEEKAEKRIELMKNPEFKLL